MMSKGTLLWVGHVSKKPFGIDNKNLNLVHMEVIVLNFGLENGNQRSAKLEGESWAPLHLELIIDLYWSVNK